MHPVRRYINRNTSAELIIMSNRSVRVVTAAFVFTGERSVRDCSREAAAMMLRSCRSSGHAFRVRRNLSHANRP